jgi:hypothetical protein
MNCLVESDKEAVISYQVTIHDRIGCRTRACDFANRLAHNDWKVKGTELPLDRRDE